MTLALTGAGLSSSGAFSPLDLSPTVWFKADAIVGKNDGDAISQWDDSSTNGRHAAQATGTKQPLYKTAIINSLPTVRFDGSDDFLNTSAFASPTTGVTVFAVTKHPANGAVRTLIEHAAAATWASPFARVCLRVSSTPKYVGWVDTTASLVTGATTPSAGAAGQITLYYDSAVAGPTIYLNGAVDVTGSATGSMTSSTRGIFIGSNTDGAECWNTDVGELIVYASGLSSTNRQAVEAYLKAKWATP